MKKEQQSGMPAFGKDGIEVLESARQPSELYGLLFNLVTYILQEDVVLHHGEIISFFGEQIYRFEKTEERPGRYATEQNQVIFY